MSSRSQMTMRALIERDANRGVADEADWRTHLEEVPCLLWDVSGEEVDGEGRRVAVESWRAILPTGTDISRLDRVASVKDRLGVAKRSEPLEVAAVVLRPDHLELVLRSVHL